MRIIGFIFAMYAVAANAQIASSRPIVDLDTTREVKLLTPREAIHADDEPEPTGETPIQRAIHNSSRIYDNMVSVELEVVINENGRVDSAHAVSGPTNFYEQAERIVMHRAYEPIHVNGTIVRARFQDSVAILPKERWADKRIPFPPNNSIKTFAISLQRTGCLGSCPSYKVTLDDRGEVTFTSPSEYGFVAVPGIHKAHVSADTVHALLDLFRKADFFSALSAYECGWTDLPSETLTLDVDGNSKKVIDYGGSVVGLPDAIEALESEVDRTAGSARWVTGNEDTLPSLKAEHWDFSSSSADNMRMYNTSIERNISSLIQTFLSVKAPVITLDRTIASPICVASRAGNKALVQQMLSQKPTHTKIPVPVLNMCLDFSAESGNTPLIQLWLDRGASPLTPHTAEDEDSRMHHPTPLLSAIRSGNPSSVALLLSRHPGITPSANNGRAVTTFALQNSRAESPEDRMQILSLLIQAGASVNDDTDDDRPAIFDADSAPEAVPLLVAAGAKINDRADDGQTPLMMNTYEATAVKALLAAGADPTLKAKDGTTALDKAKNANCAECISLIQAALKARTESPVR